MAKAVEVGRGTFLDRCGDLPHAFVAGRLRQHPFDCDCSVNQRDDSARQCKPKTLRHQYLPLLQGRNNGPAREPSHQQLETTAKTSEKNGITKTTANLQEAPSSAPSARPTALKLTAKA